jgi:MoaA/NifB/PqqE/SkfB family radical SAM enzyme
MDGYSAYPETISLFLTYACNLRCPMCGQWGDEGSFKEFSTETLRSRLTPEEIKHLVDEVASFRPNITFFGGEPMIYKGWTDIAAYIKTKKMRCNIVTNGTFLERYAKEIVDTQLDEIILSLDGIGKVHDTMRGVEGTFARLSKGVRAINAYKHEIGAKNPIMNVNCTIFEINQHSLREIAEAAGEMGISNITFHHTLFLPRADFDRHNTYFLGRFGNESPDWAGFVREGPPQVDVEGLIRTIESMKRRPPSPTNIFFYPNYTPEEIRRYYSDEPNFTATSYKNRCVSLWMTVYIFPDGSVRPYHSMNFSPGNIKEEGFKAIWNNEKFKDYRRVIKEIKRFPVCSRGCTELYRY